MQLHTYTLVSSWVYSDGWGKGREVRGGCNCLRSTSSWGLFISARYQRTISYATCVVISRLSCKNDQELWRGCCHGMLMSRMLNTGCRLHRPAIRKITPTINTIGYYHAKKMSRPWNVEGTGYSMLIFQWSHVNCNVQRSCRDEVRMSAAVAGERNVKSSVVQCFSTFVRPRPGKLFFHKKRARSQQIYSSVPFQFFLRSYIKLT